MAMQPKTATPKELGKPINPGVQITRVRFSPDGKTLLAAGFDGLVRRYDVSGKEPVQSPALPGHKGWVTAVAPYGELMVTVDSWGYMVSRAIISVNSHPSWDMRDAHDGWIRDVSVAPDRSRIATCGKDGFVRLWAAAGQKTIHHGKKEAEFDVKADVLSVQFAADGKSIYAGDLYGIVREIAMPSGKINRTFEAKELHKLDRIQDVGGVKCLLISGDSKTLLAAGGEPKTGGFVQAIPLLIAFDLATGKRVGQYKGASDNEGYVTDLAWHKDGYVVFTTSGQPGQGKFHFWKPGDEKPFFSGGKLPNCHSVALHPDGNLMAVSATNANSSGNGRVKGMGGEYPANSSPIQLFAI